MLSLKLFLVHCLDGDPPYMTLSPEQFMRNKKRKAARSPSIISVHSTESEQEAKRTRVAKSPSVEIIGTFIGEVKDNGFA